ncbi:NAD(P)/FAD-dependent oxidoreductase [Chryseotalea sanaruensis]|uniref:NAD(P)/FAD-dependent oxidoreductase n=1 Tax=Chryseotalea sanaruensis TaxID=2482724 RepID=A0A401U8B3_9BACT|nr:NAD(P)/FAD-dependent oxidoreductase [Chryseotalea sanaruensis]GCC51117.1 NAD(P)/FAD-dependent oxidoreductase [Chryseotalea sanaruensis]
MRNNAKIVDVVIIGGGLAGLLSAIKLSSTGISVCLIEKKSYPFHRVCGEYISNEVVPYLKSIDAFPEALTPSKINRFQLSAINGKSSFLPLDLGGFGISRYAFDYFLYEKALQSGATFMLNTEVSEVVFKEDMFEVSFAFESLKARIVIGSFGKRSKLDVSLKRSFINKRSPYVGVKYHVRSEFPNDLVALHNFEGGYCGVSNVEDNKTNLCYLVHRNVLKKHGNIEALEKNVLLQNPHLKEIFSNSEFLFDKPETINEISFETKEPVLNHILMAGDAAGMITPLCGNGMAIAIHASKIASELVEKFINSSKYSRAQLEADYTKQWKQTFANRLWFGRQVQQLFGSKVASNFAINLLLYSKPLAQQIVKGTHGKVF